MSSGRLVSALESPQANIVSPQHKPRGNGLSIKGKAGPFVVEASNFAPGTTAADIESALQSETMDKSGVSGMLSCRLIKTTPSVIAEMVFSEKAMAAQVISTYHNQKADGRILKLELTRSGPGSYTSVSQSTSQNLPASIEPAIPDIQQPQPGDDDIMEDIEETTEGPSIHDDRISRERSRNAEPDVTDGRYGFEETTTSDANQDRARDNDRQERDNRDRDYERDRARDRDRDRDRDREHDSHRDRDRERDGRGGGERDGRERYDRRDDRAPGSNSYQRDSRQDSYNSRASHYGNGVGGQPGRGMFGGGMAQGPGMFSRGGGRMYSDDVMRGGLRGRGSFGSGGYGRGRY